MKKQNECENCAYKQQISKEVIFCPFFKRQKDLSIVYKHKK